MLTHGGCIKVAGAPANCCAACSGKLCCVAAAVVLDQRAVMRTPCSSRATNAGAVCLVGGFLDCCSLGSALGQPASGGINVSFVTFQVCNVCHIQNLEGCVLSLGARHNLEVVFVVCGETLQAMRVQGSGIERNSHPLPAP